MSTSTLRLLEPIPWQPNLTGEYPGQQSYVELGAQRVRMVFCWCPPQEPEPGGSEAQHPLPIPKGFWLAQHPVNQEQWQAVTGTNPSRKGKGDRHPVDSVSWNDAQKFCREADLHLPASLRLPTEAEWEYACRAGTTTPFGVGAGECLNAQMANFDGNYPDGSGREAFKWLYRERTLPQGSFPPNAWGLHDLHGQLWEWCEDLYEADGRYRVLRGGSWIYDGRRAGSAIRYQDDPGIDFVHFGFRPCPSSTHPKPKPKAGGREPAAERGKE